MGLSRRAGLVWACYASVEIANSLALNLEVVNATRYTR